MELSGKKVLVTGADGFIGSHLTELLVKSGCTVRALSYYNSFNNWGWLEDLECLKEIEVVSGDIRDPFFCSSLTKGIDIIFNLAALIAIPYSYVAPASYVETNINGALNICNAAKENGAQRVIQMSTSEVYGSAQYVPIDEKHPLAPQSPYSASKIGADAIVMSYYYAFELPVTIARAFNTYGPRQSARAFIPTIITQLAVGKKKIKLGNILATRDLNFVTDTAQGLCNIARSDETIGDTVNIGSNAEHSIEKVFNIINDIMGTKAEIEIDQQRLRPEKSEVSRLWCDNTKIKSLTGYTPQFDMHAGLTETIQWFQQDTNLAKYKHDLYNL